MKAKPGSTLFPYTTLFRSEIACRSNLANSYAGAIIETSPAGLFKRPSYYAMQLYARHAKPIPLRLEHSNDALDVFACASPDGKSLCLFALNPSTEPVECSYRFDGFAGAVHEASAAGRSEEHTS